MKKNIQIFLPIFALFFLIACEKENIQQLDHLEDFDRETNGTTLNGIEKENLQFRIYEAPPPDIPLINEQAFSEKIDVAGQCRLNDCAGFIEEYSNRLQILANETCEVQFGSVACCLEGSPIYVMMRVNPERLICATQDNEDVEHN